MLDKQEVTVSPPAFDHVQKSRERASRLLSESVYLRSVSKQLRAEASEIREIARRIRT